MLPLIGHMALVSHVVGLAVERTRIDGQFSEFNQQEENSVGESRKIHEKSASPALVSPTAQPRFA